MTTEYQKGIGVDVWLLGLSFIEIASIAAAVELIVGVLKCRPPGMRLNLIPLYSWYILVVAVMILFAFPPLIAGDILLEMERAFDWPFFDVSRGGDPLLWQHLFWIFGHPEVYIVFLPSIALIAMIVPTFAQTPIVGYGWVVLAAVGTAFSVLASGCIICSQRDYLESQSDFLGRIGGCRHPNWHTDILLHSNLDGWQSTEITVYELHPRQPSNVRHRWIDWRDDCTRAF